MADMPLHILSIDINGLGYAAMFQPALSRLSHNGKSTAAIYGAVSSVFAMMKQFPEYHPVVLWDGKSQWRHDLYPDYKSNRSDEPAKVAIRESYRAQIPDIQRLLHAAGIPQVYHADVEADDLGGVINRLLPKSSKIIMGSKDEDWWQALQENASWYSNLTKKMVDLAVLSSGELKDGAFRDPQQYVQAKALAGDSSDCIAGIPDVGLKTAVKFIEKYGSVEAIWDAYDRGEKMTGVVLQRIAGPDYREMYKTNLRLMDWKLADGFDGSKTQIIYQARDMDLFNAICDEFNIKKFPSGIVDVVDYTASITAIREVLENHDLVMPESLTPKKKVLVF